MGCDDSVKAFDNTSVYGSEYSHDGTNANILMKCMKCASPFTKIVALNLSQAVE
jgi:hypothetical protein